MSAPDSDSKTRITDLPADILYIIFPYLTPFEFLNLTNCTRTFFPYRQDPAFWHTVTRKTFRLPPQPLLQGERWQWLYRKLLTQTRLYTWGDNKSGNLGLLVPGNSKPESEWNYRRRTGWPSEPTMLIDVGIISDVQCGGWSTTLLNSNGQLFIFGIFDGISYRFNNPSRLRQLSFPPAYPATTRARYEPSTAIKQFSTGRSSVLGLADDGRVWSWTGETGDTGVSVKSVHVDMIEHEVLEVQAGWVRNSMYVKDVGLVYWSDNSESPLVQGGQQHALAFEDTILIDTVTIPGTSYRQMSDRRNSLTNSGLEEQIGEVKHYVVLNSHIVFTTHLNKIFSYVTTFPLPEASRPEPVELTSFYLQSHGPFQIRDIQGSFTNFSVFTKAGAILIGTQSLLDTHHSRATGETNESREGSLPHPFVFPSLQSSTVISIAFGDHHLHALHSNGTITSLGKELQHCGALGLGGPKLSPFRGVLSTRRRWGDGYLNREMSTQRTIWFEPLMQKWLNRQRNRSDIDGSEAKARVDLIASGNEAAREAMGDWFEQEGRKWDIGVASSSSSSSSEEESEMGAYFVLKVAAAGWHSAALVLVDEEKAERARQKHVYHQHQPEDEKSLGREEEQLKAKKKSGPPSLASNETIDSPSEQLAKAVYDIFCWVRDLGRRFLGLRRMDGISDAVSATTGTASNVAVTESGAGANSDDEGEDEGVEYTWNDDVLPRLRMRDGSVMPGTKEVVG